MKNSTPIEALSPTKAQQVDACGGVGVCIKKKLLGCCFFFLMVLSLPLQATHLVGGEIYYECVGGNDYKITLRVYRDCGPGSAAGFDATGAITVYYGDNTLIGDYNAQKLPTQQLPNTVNNPCLQVPPNVCTESSLYEIVLNLPPDPRGYYIIHQRCCRNNTINNIPLPGQWGNTYWIQIPPNDFACNSSPAFNIDPPVVLCAMDTLAHSFAVTETDGDSLYYELCTPLHGGGNQTNTTNNFNTPLPRPAAPPPYTNVPFLPAYNLSAPLPANPTIQIDPNTGLMTGTPTALGQYVFAVCVTEYKNGFPISTLRRDFQFNVVICNSNVVAAIVPQNPLDICVGRTVNFVESSLNAQFFEWDFGDPASGANNTSLLRNPVHNFSDTGWFNVRLIANPGYSCADTTFQRFYVQDPLDASFDVLGNPCIDAQDWRFVLRFPNRIDSTAQFDWTFGTGVGSSRSFDRNPQNVIFPTAGIFPVTLTITYKSCTATFSQSVKVFNRPRFDFDFGPQSGCVPFTFEPESFSVADTNIFYEWDFGNGNFSNLANPSFVFFKPDRTPVRLRTYTSEGCADTAEYFIELDLFETPTSTFEVNPDRVSYYEALVKVRNIGANPEDFIAIDMGDGMVYLQRAFEHQYRDTGWFEVTQIVVTPDGCADTAKIPVYVAPEILIFVPNAFTPNDDGTNDLFSWGVTGAKEFEIIVLSRWGDEVFRTTDLKDFWNGAYRNQGETMQEGVYSWVVHVRGIDNKFYKKMGTVLLSK